jgi:pimeloyl-ACP methyl ester carboxylesterase
LEEQNYFLSLFDHGHNANQPQSKTNRQRIETTRLIKKSSVELFLSVGKNYEALNRFVSNRFAYFGFGMNDYVAINNIHLFVERHGHGEPLLLIPGLGAGTWLWAKNVACWAKHFDLIMPELRGSGRSHKPDEQYTIGKFAADLKALLDELEIEQAHVLGVSMGGFVAQHLAASWSERVRKLVLVATSLGGQCQIGPDGETLSRLIRPRGKTRRERLEDGYALNFSDDFMASHAEDLERITEWRTNFPQPEHIYHRQLLAGNAYHGAALAARISAPTLICAGKDDPLVPLANAHALQQAIPQAQLQIFEGKHMFFFEHPRKFNQAVLDFLHDNIDDKHKQNDFRQND